MQRNMWYTALIAIAATGVLGAVAPSTLDADPPARVGRLNYMTGSVSFRPAGSDEWAPAVPNRPLTTGDRLWTDNDSRAEVHVGSVAIRINSQTELDFTLVDDNTLQMRLAQGSMTIRVRNLDDGQVYEIDTPNGAVSIGQAGEYRVDVGPDGTNTSVSVWSGDAAVTSAGSSFTVNAHQQASISGTESPTYNLADAPAPDAWDQWVSSRDVREDNAVSARYVSREMPGYEDLDEYGQWRYVSGYGQVWVPANQAPGWAPYHTGHWVWVDPWGWSWVDDAPWGYAPYHYGRWAYIDGGWGWIPGPIARHPYHAPALVVFVGGGPGPRPGPGVVIAAGGAVAWFALGPQEVYRPAYAVSPTYVRQVNVTNVTNVTNITNVTVINNNTTNVTYRNRTAPGAMMATLPTAFVSARPVQMAPVPVTHAMQTSAVVGASPGVVPTRSSLGVGGAAEGGVLRAPPPALESRAVVAKVAPPPAPIPFAAKQQALAANGGRPLAAAQEIQIRQSSPALARTNTTLYRPAAVAPAGGGLKPAHDGLAAATPVTGVAAHGFVPRAAAATPAATTAATPAATSVAAPAARPVTTRTPASPGTPGTPAGAGATAGATAGTPVARPPATPTRVNAPPSAAKPAGTAVGPGGAVAGGAVAGGAGAGGAVAGGAPPAAPATGAVRPPNRVPTATRVPPSAGNPGAPAGGAVGAGAPRAPSGGAASGSAAIGGGASGSAAGGKPAGTTGNVAHPTGTSAQGGGTPKNGTVNNPHTVKKPPQPRPRDEGKQPDKPDKPDKQGKGR